MRDVEIYLDGCTDQIYGFIVTKSWFVNDIGIKNNEFFKQVYLCVALNFLILRPHLIISEQMLLRDVVTWLDMYGYQFWRVNDKEKLIFWSKIDEFFTNMKKIHLRRTPWRELPSMMDSLRRPTVWGLNDVENIVKYIYKYDEF